MYVENHPPLPLLLVILGQIRFTHNGTVSILGNA